MRFRRACVCVSIILAIVIFYVVYSYLKSQSFMSIYNVSNKYINERSNRRTLYVTVVACGQKLQETLVMIKSALLFNRPKELLHFFIFTDSYLDNGFREKLDDWRLLSSEFTFELLPIRFPQNHELEWRNLFKPCASQRIFLPSLLHEIDAVLYVDTDTLFFSPVSDVWNFFDQFNTTQIAALTPEHEVENIGWYNRFARHPYYGRLGVNSGVMLMNLTRMRNFKWEAHIIPIYEEYKLRITWGDQDILNIFFYYNPEKLYIMPCAYNYRPDHCMYMSICNTSTVGIKIIHGNRGYLHSNKQPFFRVLYEAVESYELGTNVYENFLQPLNDKLKEEPVASTSCAKISKEYLRLSQQ